MNKRYYVIIVAIVFVVVVVLFSRVKLIHSNVSDAKFQLNAISIALDRYYEDFGKYPTNEEGLAVLIQPQLEQGRYFINDKFMLDPWRQKIIYRITDGNEKFILKSIGPNGVDDNGLVDDIVFEKSI